MLNILAMVLAGALGIALLVFIAMSALNARLMLAMRRGALAIMVSESEPEPDVADAIADLIDPAEQAGFAWDGLYETEIMTLRTHLAVWVHPDRDESVVRTVVRATVQGNTTTNITTEICTRFDEHNELCTSDSSSTLAGPPQDGRFFWALPGVSFDELLRRHEQARDEIMATHRLRFRPPTGTIADDIACDVLERAEFVTSRPGWWAMGPWWYFTRHLKANKPLWRNTQPARDLA